MATDLGGSSLGESLVRRSSIALLLSPVGLLVISVTRLMIVADYNTTTAIAIASSGGYVNTLLGTIIPLVPVILPYLAIALLIIQRYLLSLLTVGATLLVTPTRLAPLTALSSFTEDWHRSTALIDQYWPLSIALLIALIALDIWVFANIAQPFSITLVILSLLAAGIFLVPYVLYTYPVPKTSNYYADFMRLPWLPAEQITVKSGETIVGYTLTEDDTWMVVLQDNPRTIQYLHVDDVASRTVCQVNDDRDSPPMSPLVPLLNPKSIRLPRCGGPAPTSPASTANQQSTQWTAGEVATFDTKFSPIPGLGNMAVCASGQISATVSVELHGAAADFRIRIDQHDIMEPGAVRFNPVGAHDSFSFTFTENLRPLDGLDRHVLQLQWKSPCGAAVTLERATMELWYQSASANCLHDRQCCGLRRSSPVLASGTWFGRVGVELHPDRDIAGGQRLGSDLLVLIDCHRGVAVVQQPVAVDHGAKLDPAVKYPLSEHERMHGIIGKLMP